jgi:hypothetical protein
MKTIKRNNSLFSLVLGAVLSLIISQGSIAQELQTPYPIIFVHGLNSDNKTWFQSGQYNDIFDYYENIGLENGGNLNVTLDYLRSTTSLNNSKEDDVQLFTQNPKFGDFYTINFDVHANGQSEKGSNTTYTDLILLPNTVNILVAQPIFSVGDIICIDNEFMEVLGMSENGLVINVRRGILNSTATTHFLIKTIWNLSNESNQASIVKQGYGLKLAISAIKAKTGAKKVILVGHSMGGLAIREYLRSYSVNDVAKVVTIGTPHLGSKAAEISSLVNYVKGIDVRSDAIRDLSYNYTSEEGNPDPPYGNSPDDGIFLFGGKELFLQSETSFYSFDVNANGLRDDYYINGLSSSLSTLPSGISYSWIVSQWNNWGPNVDGDGCVRLERQFPWVQKMNAKPLIEIGDTLMTQKFHPDETLDFRSLIRGLDEPNVSSLAYEISEKSTTHGAITFGTNNNPVDIDIFKVVLSKNGKVTINIIGNDKTGITKFQILDNGLTSKVSETNIYQPIEFDAIAGTYYIQINGDATGISYQYPYTLQTSFVETPASILATSPASSLEFYDVVTTTNRVKTVKLTNNGTSNIQITNLAFTGANANQYSVTPMPPFAVNAGASIDLAVKLSPTSVGVKLANLVITNNTTTTNTIALKGTAVSTATKVLVSSSGASYNFGDTKVNSSRSKTFTFQNTGSNTLTVSNLKLEGTNAEAYSITSPSATTFDIASGEVKQITVKFLTSTIGVKNAQLAIYINADNASPKYSIDLFGNGKENIYSGSNSIITAYEYWFNDNYTNKVYVEVPPQQITTINKDFSTTDLKEGLHFLHFRLKDNRGKWSSIVSEAFHKLTVSPSGQRKISLYEYWFDNDYAQRITSTVIPTQLDILTKNFKTDLLSPGLHSYHIRYQDNVGMWSSVVSEMFHKSNPTGSQPNTISAYRYWFDRDEKNITTVNVTNADNPYTLIRDMNALNLSLGAHTIHFQFKDSRQLWSAVTNNSLTKTQSTSGFKNLTYNYEINTFPNPVENILKVNIHKPFIKDFRLEIYNCLGVMKKSIIKSKLDTEFNLDLSTYPSGMYLIKLSNNEEVYQMKVIRK